MSDMVVTASVQTFWVKNVGRESLFVQSVDVCNPVSEAPTKQHYFPSDRLLSDRIIPPEVLRFEIELHEAIDLGDGTFLRRKDPLRIKVRRDADGLHSTAPDISFDDLVEDYEELIGTTNAMCLLLWREYAQAADEDLASDALELKRRILRDFEVI